MYFSLGIARKSNYEGKQEYKGAAVTGNIEIYRTDFGVPIISAKDEKDGFFALGFVHAQDRLWQMELNKIIAYGRLSEIFGARFVQTDKFVHILALDDIAAKTYNHLPAETKKLLQAYSDGVNYFVEKK